MKDLSIDRQILFICRYCEYAIQVQGAPESISIKCVRCEENLVKSGDKSKIDLDKYDEGLSFWFSCGCPDCFCEEVYIDCSEPDQITCECRRPDCGNYDVFIHGDAS